MNILLLANILFINLFMTISWPDKGGNKATPAALPVREQRTLAPPPVAPEIRRQRAVDNQRSNVIYPTEKSKYATPTRYPTTSSYVAPYGEVNGSTVIVKYPDTSLPPQSPSNMPPPTQQQPLPETFLEYQAPNRVLEPNRFGPPKQDFPEQDPFEYRSLRTKDRNRQ